MLLHTVIFLEFSTLLFVGAFGSARSYLSVKFLSLPHTHAHMHREAFQDEKFELDAHKLRQKVRVPVHT